MSESESLRILIVLTDNHLAHQISQKIRARFPTMPIETDRVDDGRRALGEFQQKKPDVIIAGSDLPGLGGSSLAREIRKHDGALPIFFLKSGEAAAPDSVEVVSLPLVDWTDFLTRLQASLPDDLKSKYGLFTRDSHFYQSLVDYGRRFSEAAVDESSLPSLSLVPSYFDQSGSDSPSTPGNPGTPPATTSTVRPAALKIQLNDLSPALLRKSLQLELSILGALTLLALITHLVPALARSEDLFSLKNLSLWLSSFAYLGFFLGRIFDRYFLKPNSSPNP